MSGTQPEVSTVEWLRQIADRGRLCRVLRVPTMRFSAHDDTLRAFTIAAPAGIMVLRPFESDTGVLMDGAAQQGTYACDVLQREVPGRETP